MLRVIVFCIASFYGVLSVHGQRNPGSRITTRPVKLPAQSSSTIFYAIAIVKSTARPGGIATIASVCKNASNYHFPAFKGSVRSAVEQLKTVTHTPVTLAEKKGVIVIANPSRKASLLTTLIRKFEFDASDSLTKITSDLLALPEISKAAEKLHLVERSPELGFSSIPAQRALSKPITVNNVSLLDALDTIAATRPKAVWVYEQPDCGGTVRLFSLNWVVR